MGDAASQESSVNARIDAGQTLVYKEGETLEDLNRISGILTLS